MYFVIGGINMEIKKCTSCGAFITTEETICDSCKNKMNYDMTLLKNYFDENPSFNSISEISVTTGISPTSIQKYMQENDYNAAGYGTTFSSIKY